MVATVPSWGATISFSIFMASRITITWPFFTAWPADAFTPVSYTHLGYDQNLLAEIADYFTPIREEALKSGLLNPKVLGVNIKTLQYQVPGGMLSNLVSQLKEAGQEDKYRAVLEEIPRVRKDFGEPPLVTPSSQIVGTQAVMNLSLIHIC